MMSTLQFAIKFFACKNAQDMIHFMETNEYLYNSMGMFIERCLERITNDEDALIIATKLKECFGVDRICRESTLSDTYPMTIMDNVNMHAFGVLRIGCESCAVCENDEYHMGDNHMMSRCANCDDPECEEAFKRSNRIISIFESVGFKRADECDINMLRNDFCENDWYRGLSRLNEIFPYDYVQMKENSEWLRSGIIEHVYQPRFIQKWIDDGNDVENYMM